MHERNKEVTGALLALPGRELTTLMPGLRFDDQYPTHRKVAGLSDAAFRLHTAAIFWCARNDTDGFVPEEDLDLVCAQVRDPARFAKECVHRGAWHMADQACESEDCPGPRDEPGWTIHDWRIYPAGDEEEVTEKKSSGGKLGNHRRWHEARGVTDPACPWCPDGQHIGIRSHTESDSDRIPISDTDRSANPRSRDRSKDLSLVDVVNQSSRRNARTREAPIQSPLLAIAKLADQLAHVQDDDDLLKAVIGSMKTRTGRVIVADQARSIAADILGAAKCQVGDPAAYVRKAITSEPDPVARWLATGDTGHVAPLREPWCRKCSDEIKRQVEDADGRPRRCPDCHPLRRAS